MKLFIIFLAVIMALSACNADFDLPEIDFGDWFGGSATVSPGGSTDPEEPEEPLVFSVSNWHTSDHSSECKKVSPCGNCGKVFTVEEVKDLSSRDSYYFGWGNVADYGCSSCDGTVRVTVTHCLVNGKCHDCNFECSHTSEDAYSESQPSFYSTLPAEHPLLSYLQNNDYPYQTDGYYDEDNDSVCDLCGMTIEVEEPEEPSEPEETFDLTNWHTADHISCVEAGASATCYDCETVYTDVNDERLTPYYTETFAYGFSLAYTCECGGTCYFEAVHCFVNGVCHGCSTVCDHIPGTEISTPTFVWLPEGHPLHDIERWESESYVVDGVCQLCGMTVN